MQSMDGVLAGSVSRLCLAEHIRSLDVMSADLILPPAFDMNTARYRGKTGKGDVSFSTAGDVDLSFSFGDE
jgi:hypothetical protein